MMVTSFSSKELTIPKATVLGVTMEISEPFVDRINTGNGSELGLTTSQQRKRRNKALYQKLLQRKLDHLSKGEREPIEPVVLEYAHVFHDEETNNFKGTNVIEHHILVGDAQPIRKPQCRVPYSLRNEMKAQVKKILDKDVIRESIFTWSAPAILAPKKSLDGRPKFWFCVYF
jgi:hypothetical protein